MHIDIETYKARSGRVSLDGIDGVMAAKPVFADRARLDAWTASLRAAVEAGDRAAAESIFEAAIPHFRERFDKPVEAAAAGSQAPVGEAVHAELG